MKATPNSTRANLHRAHQPLNPQGLYLCSISPHLELHSHLALFDLELRHIASLGQQVRHLLFPAFHPPSRAPSALPAPDLLHCSTAPAGTNPTSTRLFVIGPLFLSLCVARNGVFYDSAECAHTISGMFPSVTGHVLHRITPG